MRNLLVVWMACLIISCGSPNEEKKEVQSVLFLGEGENQPLIVGLGGSEGGNAWATDIWKPTRDKFIASGYAFLAIGYFGAEGTPGQLDRISLDVIHTAIMEAVKNSKVADEGIAIIGGSKGAEAALLLGSYFPDITCVVSIVGSHAAFPALTFGASSSAWTINDKEVPYVPATWSSAPALLKRDLRRAFEIMMEDSVAVNKALIKVENIRGPVLCVSASHDEMWPSAEMSAEVMKRLDEKSFPYVHEHIIAEGGHTESLDHFNDILAFLVKHYPAKPVN
ncbi:MAG TPA: acyl-CoA thioester hydrolase/BAAT C-terminal domain-containing protein [Ohtaekwangia sp.]